MRVIEKFFGLARPQHDHLRIPLALVYGLSYEHAAWINQKK